MAQLYALEPQTTSKVLLKTNFGDLELELWGAQTPLTTRNFLQLCYDGYYDNTIFHRLVPGFILQGGDPTGTGHGGEAIYPGGLFADEFHPRLKYNRRGLIGMANSGRKDDNGSQFFLTLGDTKELTGKNTLFGKIVGDTIYNLVRMGELEVEEGNERPLFPPKVLATEVLVNPFEDVKPRETKRKADVLEKTGKRPVGGKKKSGKALLSFMGDEEEGMAAPMPVKKKPKFNTRLVVDAPILVEDNGRPSDGKSQLGTPPSPPPKSRSRSPTPPPRRETPKPSKSAEPSNPPARARSSSRTPSPPPSKSALLLSKTNAQITELQRSLRRSASPPLVPAAVPKKRSLLTLQKSLLPSTSIQGRKKKRRKGGNDADDEASFLALQKFREKLASAPPPAPSASKSPTARQNHGEKDVGAEQDAEAILCDLHFIPNCQSCSSWDREENEDEGEGGETTSELWGHALSFEKDRLGKDLSWKKKNEELVVIDPREKQKEILGKRRGGGDKLERRENNRRREARGR